MSYIAPIWYIKLLWLIKYDKLQIEEGEKTPHFYSETQTKQKYAIWYRLWYLWYYVFGTDCDIYMAKKKEYVNHWDVWVLIVFVYYIWHLYELEEKWHSPEQLIQNIEPKWRTEVMSV